MTVRLTVTVAVLAMSMGACAHGFSKALAVQEPAAAASDGAVGRAIDEVMAANGPPSGQWDLPDGRHAYQWQASSVTARVGATRNGEVQGAASQTTCYYTLYTRPDAKGVAKVVGYDSPRPGCMKLAMNGTAK
jgi:hypothetical protein